MNNCAVQINVNGKPRIIGKVFDHAGTKVFYRKYPFNMAYMRKMHALSFDANAAVRLRDEGVEEVHAVHNGMLYKRSLGELLAFGEQSDNGEGLQVYLPIEDWETGPAYEAPWFGMVVNL